MAMTFGYCNTTTDLQMVFKDVEQFNGQTRVEDFTITSGQTNTYQKEHTGLVGVCYENDTLLTVQTSIANVESNASSFYYDSTNDILYVHTSGSDDPDDSTIEIAEKSWTDLKTYMSNRAFGELENMLNPKYPRPLPFARESTYQGYNYDADIVRCAAILTCANIVEYVDPENPLVDVLRSKIWDVENQRGILWEYSQGLRAFSFETTKDEFDGNVTTLTHDDNSTGLIHLAGTGDRSNRQKIRVIISTAGAVGTAYWKYSTDLETTWSSAIKTDLQYVHLYNGVYIKFSGTYVLNDKWEIYFAGDEEVTGARIRSINLRRF